MKFSIFIGEKNLYILHGQVFVMIESVDHENMPMQYTEFFGGKKKSNFIRFFMFFLFLVLKT